MEPLETLSTHNSSTEFKCNVTSNDSILLQNKESKEEKKEKLCKEIINVFYTEHPEIDVTQLYDSCQQNISYITSIHSKK
jgi:hypothetical protein